MSDPTLSEILNKASEAAATGDPSAVDNARAALVEPFKHFKGPDGELYVTVPVKPSHALLTSMALRNDHRLFMPASNNAFFSRTEEQRQLEIDAAMTQMRQLYEEVVGTGFYNPTREAYYSSFHGKPGNNPANGSETTGKDSGS